MVSCSFFWTWPDAMVRTANPTAEMRAPSTTDFTVGRANQKYTIVKMKPVGTRIRRATRDQLAMFLSQKFDCRADHIAGRDLQHPLFRMRDPRMRSHTRYIAEHHTARCKRPVSCRVCGPEYCYDGHAQECR